VSEGGSIDFQRQLFYLPADSTETFRDFCPFTVGSKSEKNFGEGAPLWGKFNGEVENLTTNFSPPNYQRAAVRGGLDAGSWTLPNFISPATCALKFGRNKNIFWKFCLDQKLQGKNGGKFSGITEGRSDTVPIAIGQGGIAILWLRFAAGSPGNWGSHGPQKLGQILDTF